MKKAILIIGILFFVMDVQAQMTAETIVKKAFDYWRGKASISTIVMTIHRPEWERVMTLKAWTKGESDSLFVITKPAKDRGNGTLKAGKGMWMYNPKVNRVIKLPPSMMSQSWQGSDFSNNDLAKSDSLIKDYVHTLEDTKIDEGKKVYYIKSMPKPEAPVIWGMIKLTIREDNILLSESFFDEDLETVKIMTAWDIQMTNDRLFPLKWKMQKADITDEYTLFVYEKVNFKKSLSKSIFTRTNLKNPGI
ncbi:MAG: outer membrane lipoprotein-sorting protein [Desulfobacula sp.]|jgi:outer membrane lipoprotein-sorting protein|nr:outer membrane lipoprotein-sorting protein [Desulfobacula sp.]MBT7261118.1 outer membrane lipoprotein-sorting protein [Desulfobacula sp.]